VPPRAAMKDLVLKENGSPVLSLAISPRAGSPSGTYVVSYRSLLSPQVKARVSATITGYGVATTTYSTPALNFTARANHGRRWTDSRYVTVFVIVVVLSLMAFEFRAGFKHRY